MNAVSVYGMELNRVATCMMQGDVQKLRRQDEEVGGTKNANGKYADFFSCRKRGVPSKIFNRGLQRGGQ